MPCCLQRYQRDRDISLHVTAGLSVLVTAGPKKFGGKAEPKFRLSTAITQPKLTLQT
jgi:hypothetical protein